MSKVPSIPAPSQTAQRTRRPIAESTIVLRRAAPADEGAIRRLAALDARGVPAGPCLIAEVDGHPRAVLSLATGAHAADPFVPSASLVTLLRQRAEQLRSPAKPRRAASGVPRALARLVGA